MKAQEIIRAVLDILGREEQADETVQPDDTPQDQPTMSNDQNRFKQVFGLLDKEKEAIFTNRSKEQYADTEAVTTHTRGSGCLNLKHLADIKSNSIPMYSGTVYGAP
jgi:hypothetical protein